MAMVSGRRIRSTLNPNATPFIPAAYRQVEDGLSSNLAKNTSWLSNHWLSERESQPNLEGPTYAAAATTTTNNNNKDDDITNLLPDTFDVGYDGEDFPFVDLQLDQGLVRCFETTDFRPQINKTTYGMGFNAEALRSRLHLASLSSNGRGMSSLMEPAKYNERPTQHSVSFSHGLNLRHIH